MIYPLKKYLLISVFIATLSSLSAQALQGIANQVVIRNSNNELMANTTICIKVSMLHGGVEGNVLRINVVN